MVNKYNKLFKSIGKKLEKFVSLILIIFLFLLTFSLLGNISKMKEVNSKIKEVQREIIQLEKEGKDLEIELNTAQSEEYIEKQLRDKLQMSKEGEIVVILPEEKVVKRFAPEVYEEEEMLPDPNWKKWLKLFL